MRTMIGFTLLLVLCVSGASVKTSSAQQSQARKVASQFLSLIFRGIGLDGRNPEFKEIRKLTGDDYPMEAGCGDCDWVCDTMLIGKTVQVSDSSFRIYVFYPKAILLYSDLSVTDQRVNIRDSVDVWNGKVQTAPTVGAVSWIAMKKHFDKPDFEQSQRDSLRSIFGRYGYH